MGRKREPKKKQKKLNVSRHSSKKKLKIKNNNTTKSYFGNFLKNTLGSSAQTKCFAYST